MYSPHDWTPDGSCRTVRDPAERNAVHALRLRSLHRPGTPVVIPGAWDAMSARAVVSAGFPAVAASGSAVAGSLGYPRGRAAPLEEMLDAFARMSDAVTVPVTVDLGRGYGIGPAELVERLTAAGIAGCTIDDSDRGTGRPVGLARQSDFLAAVRDAAAAHGVELVINARIDASHPPGGTLERRLEDVVTRAESYLRAGADCVHPHRLHRPSDIGTLVAVTRGHLDVRFRSGRAATPSLTELARLGVARISFGGSLHRACATALRFTLHQLRPNGEPPVSRSRGGVRPGADRSPGVITDAGELPGAPG